MLYSLSRLQQKLNRYRLLKKAQQGDAYAQFKLGKAYEFGEEGYPSHLTKAYHWYQKAAHQGIVEARERLLFLQAIIRAENLPIQTN